MTARDPRFTTSELLAGTPQGGVVENSAFMPSASAGPARHILNATLRLEAARIYTEPPDRLAKPCAGLRADCFPAVRFGLLSDGEHLVPVERDLIRAERGDCFWDLTLSPGRVWSEPHEDGDWSRAVLPFQLSNVLENDTHHGLACFVFNEETLGPILFQIVTETAPFLIGGLFDGWGVVRAHRDPPATTGRTRILQSFRNERASQSRLSSFHELADRVPTQLLDALQTGFGADTAIVNGLIIDDEIFATDCATRAGAYPLPRAMKFGIWSATKTAFATIACLRLAEVFGEDCRKARLVDLIPAARDRPQWVDVTIGDCLNMATGIGTAAPHPEPVDVFADYILDETAARNSALNRDSYERYFAWFTALSQKEKNEQALECPGYSWRPGEFARYRDQDLYLCGVGMDAWLKKKRGAQARLWELVRDEVYEPAGLHHAVKFHTVEEDRADEVPLTDAGLLLTLDNVSRLGRLLHDGGRIDERQVLSRSLLAEIFDPRIRKGLPTGTRTADGEIYYHGATWHLPYVASSGTLFWLPTMRGYGGQTIQLLPNGFTAFRFAHDSYETEERYDGLTLARIADAIRAF